MEKKEKSSGLTEAGLVSAIQRIVPEEALAKANPVAQAKIAEAYAAMQHNPNDPAVKRAYDAMINETTQQFEDLQKGGLKLSKIGDDFPNPYKSSSDLIADVKNNKHMAYYPTETGFGSGDVVSEHPLMRQTKILGPDGKPMLANDLFRVVHDYQGHVEGGNKFGATGEERAFQQHKKMFSPEAQKALASETRGQNSWVNYGPHGEANRANPAATVYADQKAGLLPDWATKDLEAIESPMKHRLKSIAKVAGTYLGPLALGANVARGITGTDAADDAYLQREGEKIGLEGYKNSLARKNALKKLQD